MYGIYAVLFVIAASLLLHQASIYSSTPFEAHEISLAKYIQSYDYLVYATCIDKPLLTNNPSTQIQLKSH